MIGSGWQSGISSAVRFAAWIAAIRATPITSPFFAVPDAINRSVSGRIRITPLATATRWVSALRRDVDHVGLSLLVEMRQG